MHLLRHALGLSLAGVLVTACATAQAPPVPVAVRPGIDVLVEDSLHLVAGRAVGLLTNRTGVDRRGVSDVERLRAAGVNLVALFTPEHGFRGAADPGAAVATTRDSATGLPIYSLYGRNFAPTAGDARRCAGAARRPAGRGRTLLHLCLHHDRTDASRRRWPAFP